MNKLANVISLIAIIICAIGCKNEQISYDASGLFNPTEITISAEDSGIVSSILVKQGELIAMDMPIAIIGDNDPIVSPINGVLTYLVVNEGDTILYGDLLGTLGDMNNMILSVYVVESKAQELEIGQNVKILIDQGQYQYKKYDGSISDINIMNTNSIVEGRQPVYKIDITVPNDGFIKINMFGHVVF